VNDVLHGFGHYSWQDGRFYEGQWQNGKTHGVGCLTNKISCYTGNYFEGHSEGYGTYKWLEKDQEYAGYWKGGKQHGLGVLTKAGVKKVGIYVKGQRVLQLDDDQVKTLEAGIFDWLEHMPDEDRKDAAIKSQTLERQT